MDSCVCTLVYFLSYPVNSGEEMWVLDLGLSGSKRIVASLEEDAGTLDSIENWTVVSKKTGVRIPCGLG